MKKFHFPLQPLFEHRRRLEDTAKNAFLNKQAEILGMEALILSEVQRRMGILAIRPESLNDHKNQEAQLIHSDDQERMHRAALSVLQNELEKLLEIWIEAKKNLEVIEKLRDTAKEEWRIEADKEEQKSIDEWAAQKPKYSDDEARRAA